MRDLEIRGAGSSSEPSSTAIAASASSSRRALGEAVAELSGQRRTVGRPVRVDARIDAYVPAHYIDSEAQKIDLHRRLSLGESEDELRELEAATVDRYGPLPEPVENLFAIQEAKLKLAQLGADYLVFRSGRSTVGPLVLGSDELGEPRTPGYGDLRHRPQGGVPPRRGLHGAIRLVDAILDARRAAQEISVKGR